MDYHVTSNFAMQIYSALFLSLSLGLVACFCANIQTYNVYPEATCQNEDNCLTLSEVLNERDKYFANNSTLLFHGGDHTLQGQVVYVSKISNFTLEGHNDSGSGLSSQTVTCVNSSYSFSDVSIRITSITFSNCNIHLSRAAVVVQDSRFENGSAVDGGALALRFSDVQFVGSNSFAGNIAERYGGAIYVDSSIATFSGNTTFLENSAQNGGAIYCTRESIILGSTSGFSGNNIMKNTGEFSDSAKLDDLYNKSSNFSEKTSFTCNTAGYGGTVCASESSVLSFTGNSCFASNTAVYGGAVYVRGRTSLSFDGDSSFVRNTAAQFGGAVYAWDNNTLSFSGNTHFINSTAKYGGSVAALHSNTLSFNGNSNFVTNTADDGGAVYSWDGNTFRFAGCSNFMSNVAVYGGAVYARERTTLTFSTNGSFMSNTAQYGGAVYVRERTTLTFTGDSSFVDNAATQFGGAVYAWDNNILSFRGNTSFIRSTTKYGGAVAALDSNILSFNGNSTFMSNTADSYGGVVYAWDSNSLSFIGNSSFLCNTALYGGAVYGQKMTTMRFSGYSSFMNNSASHGGAAYVREETTLSFSEGSSFVSNSASHGGAVYARKKTTLSFSGDSSFLRNTATQYGGALYARNNNTLSFSGSTYFMNITAKYGGAVAVLYSNTLNFNGNSNFMTNTADNGGAVYAWDNNTMSFTGNSRFMSNVAVYGGAVYARERTTLTFSTNSSFMSNTALYGGAVYARDRATFSFSGDSSFMNNTATQFGGAVYAWDNNTLSFSENTCFMNNTASYGGSVAALDSNVLSFNGNSNFMSNTADFVGGAVYARDANTFSFYDNTTFMSNFAGHYGGAVGAWEMNTLIFKGNCNFTRNTADYIGGAVFVLDDNTLSFGEVSSFVSNTAAQIGGAVYAEKHNTLGFTGNSSFMNNTAEYGGAVYARDSDILSFNGNAMFTNNTAEQDGGAVYVRQSSSLSFYGNSILGHNEAAAQGGGVALFSDSLLYVSESGTTSLLSNIGSFGGGAFVQNSSINSTGNITVSGNTAIHGGGLFVQSTVITLHGTGLFGENTVTHREGGYGGALFARSSLIEFQGSFDITNNSAEFGGGLALFGIYDGVLIIGDNTSLSFDGNLAHRRGGALYVEDDPFTFCTGDQVLQNRLDELCFFQTRKEPYDCFYEVELLTSGNHQAKNNSIILKLDNNTADVSGDVLYGGNLDSCMVCSSLISHSLGSSVLLALLEPETDVFSKLSSDPYKVCLCEHSRPNCDLREVSRTVYPGQVLLTAVVAVGQMNGTVPSVIRAVSDDLISNPDFQETQPAENNKDECSQLWYPLFSDRPKTNLKLYSDEPCSTSGYPLTFLINFLPCPVGFTLSDQGGCICDDRLQKYTQNCNIQNLSISRDIGESFWVGVKEDNELFLHPHCPFDYCTEDAAHFKLNNTDMQCANRRSGILCGACQRGHTLAIGSSRCLSDCANTFLSLLLVFIFAGVALVAFLFLCHLSVAEGTLSGIIFYVNVLAVNQTVFFPSGERNLLTVFRAWLNLDLGIETCFFVGLDAYYRTWLQFAFPIYIWVVVGVIIALADRSVLFAKIIGSTNPVAVLATLFLLSYTKLLRAIMAAFSFTTLDYPDNDSKYVWLYDGNVAYLDRHDGRHIGLFLFSLLFLLFIFLPYTLLLLCGQWIQKHLWWLSSTKQLYLKFFLEAHYGPYKNRHRYCTGLLLLLRFLMLFVATITNINNPQDPFSNLLVILAVVSSLIVWGWVVRGFYKKWYHDLLEASYLFNLVILAGSTYQVRLSGGNQAALVYTSVGIAFVTFVAIVVGAGMQHVKGKLLDCVHSTVKCRFTWTEQNQNGEDCLGPTAVPMATVTYSEVEIDHKGSGTEPTAIESTDL